MTNIGVSFENFELNELPYKVTEYTPVGSPTKSTKTYKIARNHGQKRVFESYDAPTIVVTGEIITESKLVLDDAIDDLKKVLRARSGTLRIDYGDGIREWVCTARNLIVPRARENISFAPYSIEFETEDPFARDGETDILINGVTVTTSSYDFSFTINGTMDANPEISIQVNAINPSISSTIMTIGNLATGQYLTIERIFSPGDIISIDCQEYRVFVNGVLTKAKGQFPEFATGVGSLQYTDTATTRSVVITASVERKYL